MPSSLWHQLYVVHSGVALGHTVASEPVSILSEIKDWLKTFPARGRTSPQFSTIIPGIIPQSGGSRQSSSLWFLRWRNHTGCSYSCGGLLNTSRPSECVKFLSADPTNRWLEHLQFWSRGKNPHCSPWNEAQEAAFSKWFLLGELQKNMYSTKLTVSHSMGSELPPPQKKKLQLCHLLSIFSLHSKSFTSDKVVKST